MEKGSVYDNGSTMKIDMMAIPHKIKIDDQIKEISTASQKIKTNNRFPLKVFCSNCNSAVVTDIDKKLSSLGWTVVAILFCIYCPLSWLPLLCERSYINTHSCPNCFTELSNN